jgi:hypothetical protein
MEPTAQDVLAGGGVAVAVIGLLVWAIKTLVAMLGKHLDKMEGVVTTFASDVKKELGAIKTSVDGVKTELGAVKSATEQMADRLDTLTQDRDVTPPPRPLPVANGHKPR